MIRTEAHQELVTNILIELSKLPYVRVWKQVCGTGFLLGNKRRQAISFGTPGMADISGVIGPTGRRLELEVKTGNARQTREQQVWEIMIKKYGGLYVVCRSIDDALDAVKGTQIAFPF